MQKKGKKKSGNQDDRTLKAIILITAILNLTKTVIELFEKLIE
jgi:hypothetical protein